MHDKVMHDRVIHDRVMHDRVMHDRVTHDRVMHYSYIVLYLLRDIAILGPISDRRNFRVSHNMQLQLSHRVG